MLWRGVAFQTLLKNEFTKKYCIWVQYSYSNRWQIRFWKLFEMPRQATPLYATGQLWLHPYVYIFSDKNGLRAFGAWLYLTLANENKITFTEFFSPCTYYTVWKVKKYRCRTSISLYNHRLNRSNRKSMINNKNMSLICAVIEIDRCSTTIFLDGTRHDTRCNTLKCSKVSSFILIHKFISFASS